jgi:hypothetical protein
MVANYLSFKQKNVSTVLKLKYFYVSTQCAPLFPIILTIKTDCFYTKHSSIDFMDDCVLCAVRTETSILVFKGSAMAQALISRPITAEARVRSWASPCEICD